MSFLLIMLIGAICSLIFIFTDLGCKHINDNILNSLLPGLAVWLMLTIW